ncbi:hypothetical protein [Parvibaculum sp.]|uniref:hypothetical protein n=1 Tax=Parvibaculum sp. TaxID=2024848 RepID=UPI002FDAC4FA
MTVCIAARSQNVIFLAADRMLTAGDIQFEPPASKVHFLTTSIAIMFSGDSSFHSEVLKNVHNDVKRRVKEDPEKWLFVKDIAEMYVRYRNAEKFRRAEAAILEPLGLDRDSFFVRQHELGEGLAATIARDLIQFDVPDVSVIVAGVDDRSGSPMPHIYTIYGSDVRCDDSIAFAAIGSGARHAESQFMLARHAWNSEIPETLLLLYAAKKSAEIAPGVGSETDLFGIGPGLGQVMIPLGEGLINKLKEQHENLRVKQAEIQNAAEQEVHRYVDELVKTPKENQAHPSTAEGESEPEATE